MPPTSIAAQIPAFVFAPAQGTPEPPSWNTLLGLLLAFSAVLLFLLWQRLRGLDIRARLQRRLDEAERWKDLNLMAGGLAHEIRHPVSSVQFAVASALERLARMPQGTERAEIEEILEGIGHDVKRLEEITNAFLQYARPDEQPVVDCDVLESCEFVHRFLKVEIRSRGVRLETQYPSHPVIVRMAEVHLRQILMNLVLNAVQASSAGGVVHLRVLDSRDRVAVEVEDEGPGVPEDAVSDLFRPFFTRKSGGVGLGLALSRRLARDAQGDLTYRRAKSGGALFTLVLPRATPWSLVAPSAASEVPAAAGAAAPSKGESKGRRRS